MILNINMKRFITFFFIITCVFTWNVLPVGAEQFTSLVKVSVNDVYLTAGQENTIEISLSNTGDFNVYEVESYLTVPATVTGITILNGAHKIYNKIGDGSVKRFYPVLYVDRDTPLGAYTLSFHVDYIQTYKQGALLLESADVQVGVVVHNVSSSRVDVDVSIEASGLRAGGEAEVSITLENIGEESVYDLDAKIESSSSYIVLPRGSRYTGEILGLKEATTFEPTISVSRNAPLGVYSLSATLSYEDSEGKEYYEVFTLGVNVNAVEVEKQTSVILQEYETQPDVIQPGDTFNLDLVLACSGARAYEVKAALVFTPGIGLSPLTPTLVAVGDMEPGDEEAVTYQLIIDGGLRAGQYPATLTLGYLDVDGMMQNDVESVTFSVRGIVEFNLINVETMNANVGKLMNLEADILLIGTESVKFVDVWVEEDQYFGATLGSREYLGAVDPDSPIPFDVHVLVRDNTPLGDYDLKLGLKYTDDLNKEHEASIFVPVKVITSTDEVTTIGGGGFWGWLRNLLGLRP
jgi:hypothetical protein